MKKFLYFAAMALMMASCTEDFKDWAEPQSNPQAEAIAFGDGSVAPVGVIDFAEVADSVESLKVCDLVAPSTTDAAYAPEYYIILNGQTFVLTTDGMMSRDELESYVLSTYGQAPEQRDIPAQVKCVMTNGTTATTIMSDEFVVSVIPDAPVISSAYYYVGTSNGWTACDPTYQLSNGGGDVYANPVFTVVVPATGEDNWFKIYPQETMDLGADGFWGGNFIGYAENGANDLTGSFVEGANDQVAYAFMIPASIEADKYRLTFDMLNRTFTIEPIVTKVGDLWYLVGSCIGDGSWGNSADGLGAGLIAMYPTPGNSALLTWTGYLPAGQGFKLIHTPGNWDEQWGMSDGVLVKNDGGSGNIEVSADGYYTIEYDLDLDNVTITAYAGTVAVQTAIYMPGGYQGWNAAENAMNAMSSVVENHDWVLKGVTYDTDTELKFAANGSWDVNWGAATFPVGQGVQNGANIPVMAGTYNIVFNDITGIYNFISL